MRRPWPAPNAERNVPVRLRALRDLHYHDPERRPIIYVLSLVTPDETWLMKVGLTTNLERRLERLREEAEAHGWAFNDVRYLAPAPEDATRLERALIRHLRPVWNRNKRGTPPTEADRELLKKYGYSD